MERCIFIRAKSRTEGGWAPEKTVVVSMDAAGLAYCRGPSVPVRHTGRKMGAPLAREEKSGKSRLCRLKSPVRWSGRRKGLWEELFWGWFAPGSFDSQGEPFGRTQGKPFGSQGNLKPRPPEEW